MMSNITNNTSKRFFAPLKEPFTAAGSHLRKLEGVVFDMDGTLWYVLLSNQLMKSHLHLDELE